MKDFLAAVNEHIATLDLYTPIVARVHGEAHPEFHVVKQVYDEISPVLKSPGSEKPELDEAFAKLREITDNYKVPDDVCESYEAVYQMLQSIDQAYSK